MSDTSSSDNDGSRCANLDSSRYNLVETLGTGTFGRVYLANYRGTDVPTQYFAMKVLKKVDVVRLKQVEHMQSEKSILAMVNCPFIINMYCAFQDSRNLYMLLEYVCGGELFSHLRKATKFPPDVARFFAAEIALALEYLHSMNIIYRDLKPENLLLDEAGHIKITDFGFAKVVEDRTWTLCGTPEYLAPEIIESKGHGKPVDWWALGILIYEMLAGYPPFFDDNPFGIYEKILQGRVAYGALFDATARNLISRLLSRDRTKRLGNLKNGSEDIKKHKFFRGINWDAILAKEVPSPLHITIKDAGDTSNFEKYEEEISEELEGLAIDPFKALFKSFDDQGSADKWAGIKFPPATES